MSIRFYVNGERDIELFHFCPDGRWSTGFCCSNCSVDDPLMSMRKWLMTDEDY